MHINSFLCRLCRVSKSHIRNQYSRMFSANRVTGQSIHTFCYLRWINQAMHTYVVHSLSVSTYYNYTHIWCFPLITSSIRNRLWVLSFHSFQLWLKFKIHLMTVFRIKYQKSKPEYKTWFKSGKVVHCLCFSKHFHWLFAHRQNLSISSTIHHQSNVREQYLILIFKFIV